MKDSSKSNPRKKITFFPSLFYRLRNLCFAFVISVVMSGCGLGNLDNGDDFTDAILAFLGNGNPGPNQTSPTEMGQEGLNSPIAVIPPDEVLATNPAPPPVGAVSPRVTDPSSLVTELGPRLRVEIDSINFTLAQNFNFLSRQMGTSEDKTVTLTNEGDKNLEISTLEVVGASNQFQRISGFNGGTITPGNSVSFVVRFTPAGVGLRSGEMRLINNDPRAGLGFQSIMANFTLRLLGAGTHTPTATVLKTASSVSRFQRIVVEFSHEMDRGTVCNGAVGRMGSETYAHRGGGNQIRLINLTSMLPVEGRCSWTGLRQLVLQPFNGLDSLTNYRLELDDALVHSSLTGITPDDKINCSGLVNMTCNTNRRTQLTTEAKFEANLAINGKSVTGSGSAGLVLDKSIHPTITLSGTIGENFSASSIRIKKIGVDSSIYHTWNGFSSVNLSSLANTQLRPHDGSNGYYAEIVSGGKTYIRNFGFNWGLPQINPTTSPVLAGGRVNIGTGGFGVGQLAKLLEKFANSDGSGTNGNWVLNGQNFDTFYQTPIVSFFSSNGHPSSDPAGNPCKSDWSNYLNFNYIQNLGPFCNIEFSFLGSGRVDAYVKELYLEKKAQSGSNNILVNLSPQTNWLDIILTGRRLYGKLQLNVGEHWIVDNYVYEVSFAMNYCSSGGGCSPTMNKDSTIYPPSYANSGTPAAYRDTNARVVLNIPLSDGKVRLEIIPPYNSKTATNFNVAQWSDNILAYNADRKKGGSFIGWIIDIILDSLIPNLQWEIVQGIIRDVIQVVARDVFNAIFFQLRIEPGDLTPNGIGVRLPDYLPDPFNRTKLYIGANLRQNTTNRTGSDGLDLGADIGILSCMNPNSSTDTCLPTTNPSPSSLHRPLLHTGTGFVDSFVLSAGTTDASLPPSQLANGVVNGNNGTGIIANHPGVLLAVRMDVINQVLYNLWRKGTFELSFDQNFANQVRAYRGSSDRLFQIFQTLLKAENLLRVVAPGQTQVFYGPGANDVINGNDDIIFRLKPFSPPHVKPAHLDHSAVVAGSGGRKFPLADIEWSDLYIEVFGKRSDNTEYKITTLKINFLSRAGINIHRFNSPVNGGVNNYLNVTSIQLNVCDDNTASPSTFDCDLLRNVNALNDDLRYTLEVLDNPTDNPLGLDPRGIQEVLDPSVQKLILPVVNFVLEELPLEEKSFSLPTNTTPNQPGTREDPNHPNNKIMANCGLRLEDMSVKPIPPTTNPPYILIHTTLQDYTFSGNCRL